VAGVEERAEGRFVGAHRAVLRLAKRTGLRVGRADIDVLVEQGVLVAAGQFNGWPTYDPAGIDSVPADLLDGIVVEREAWLAGSVDGRTAAAALGIQLRELTGWVTARDVRCGRFGRFSRADIAALVNAPDEERPVSEMTRWAWRMLEPGTAVLLDTETADLEGPVCEIAVVDVATGQVLLDTVVDPGMPIAGAAQDVHGIAEVELAGAPLWPEVAAALMEVTEGRVIVAYQAEYDRRVVRADCERYGVDARHLGEDGNWECLMSRRLTWLGTDRRLPLGGPHRALGDCRAALGVLRTIAGAPAGLPNGAEEGGGVV